MIKEKICDNYRDSISYIHTGIRTGSPELIGLTVLVLPGKVKYMEQMIDVVVVGAGQAGLAVSFLLKQAGIQHIVLERGEIGESWRSQRWDSFYLNTPNWISGLPGMEFDPEAADSFSPGTALVSYFQHYVAFFDLPVREHIAVTALERCANNRYLSQTGSDSFSSRVVVLASGSLNCPRVPKMAHNLPENILNISAGTYKNPEALPGGAVVVVGCGQSGCQITEDLLAAGREVYLSASRVARVPRVYRGREILRWWRDMGILDVRLDQLEDPVVQFAAQPQVSGTDGGHTVSLQSLARDGALLLGRIVGINGSLLKLDNDLRECIAFADQRSQAFKAAIDAFIEREGIQAKPAEQDPGEPPLPDLHDTDKLKELDLFKAGVSTVIWCSGFDADWHWVKIDVFDEKGRPRHHDGISVRDGLYFVGLPWLSKRKSGILYGVSEDARRIVQHLETYLHLPSDNPQAIETL
jgi:putative flavoprotein involved in K+ transport